MTGEPELTLFDLGSPETPRDRRRSPRPAAGRARESFRRRVTAEVRIVQPAVLRDEALRVLDTAAVVVLGAAEEEPPDDDETRQEICASSATALEWVLDPTAGLRQLQEADAFRIVSLDMSVAEVSPVECTVGLAVTVKLQDVGALRAAALAALPAGDVSGQAEVRASLEAAWNRAADPYAPLRGLPGITWVGREVTVEQVMARAGRG